MVLHKLRDSYWSNHYMSGGVLPTEPYARAARRKLLKTGLEELAMRTCENQGSGRENRQFFHIKQRTFIIYDNDVTLSGSA